MLTKRVTRIGVTDRGAQASVPEGTPPASMPLSGGGRHHVASPRARRSPCVARQEGGVRVALDAARSISKSEPALGPSHDPEALAKHWGQLAPAMQQAGHYRPQDTTRGNSRAPEPVQAHGRVEEKLQSSSSARATPDNRRRSGSCANSANRAQAPQLPWSEPQCCVSGTKVPLG